jgi:spore coat protein U-like protein
MNRKILLTALAAATLAIGNVYAAPFPTTATNSFNVTITVVNSCTITVNPVAFGTVNTLITSATAASVGDHVTCTGTSPVTVSFNTGSSGLYTNRTMTNATDVVNYNLFDSNAYTNVLGDGSGSTVTIGLTPTGGGNVAAADDFTVYGQTVAGQAVVNKSYSDTIIATVAF